MIHIDAAGLRATIQDRGRFDHLREGVPPSGPADPAAFARPGETFTVLGGERSRFAYLAVSGGIATETILGSRSAYLPAGIGHALRPGEALPLGAGRLDADRAGRSALSPDYDTGQIRAITGPHAQRFTDEADSLFFRSEFRVEPASDRMGTRLSGSRIAAREGEILTCGVVAGAVQIPSGGAPIILLAEHQATGGYPVIATVISADLGLVAQRLPGERLRFARVDRDLAVAALRDERARLEAIA